MKKPKFRDLMTRESLTAFALSRTSSVSLSTIAKCRSGLPPRDGLARLLASALGVSLPTMLAAIEREV